MKQSKIKVPRFILSLVILCYSLLENIGALGATPTTEDSFGMDYDGPFVLQQC